MKIFFIRIEDHYVTGHSFCLIRVFAGKYNYYIKIHLKESRPKAA